MMRQTEAAQPSAGNERVNDVVPIGQGDVSLIIDGRQVRACTGETLLTVLHALGQRAICRNDRQKETGAWCGMGICHACTVLVDGRKARACLTQIKEGMTVRTRSSLFELHGANEPA